MRVSILVALFSVAALPACSSPAGAGGATESAEEELQHRRCNVDADCVGLQVPERHVITCEHPSSHTDGVCQTRLAAVPDCSGSSLTGAWIQTTQFNNLTTLG